MLMSKGLEQFKKTRWISRPPLPVGLDQILVQEQALVDRHRYFVGL